MNKLSLVLNFCFAAAIVVLFVLFVGLKKQIGATDNATAAIAPTSEKMPIAYINVDSLLLNYNFSVDANEELIKKEEDIRLQINTKMKRLQTEAAEFQRKLNNNAFLSRDRAEQAQNTLVKKERDLQELQAELSQELMVEQQNVSLQLRDTINTFLKEFNKDKKFHMIVSNTANDNILLADEAKYDITAVVIEQLNARYKK